MKTKIKKWMLTKEDKKRRREACLSYCGRVPSSCEIVKYCDRVYGYGKWINIQS